MGEHTINRAHSRLPSRHRQTGLEKHLSLAHGHGEGGLSPSIGSGQEVHPCRVVEGEFAVVLSPQNEILVVLERRHIAANPGYYKLPGGLVEQGERLVDAAIREVFEGSSTRRTSISSAGSFRSPSRSPLRRRRSRRPCGSLLVNI